MSPGWRTCRAFGDPVTRLRETREGAVSPWETIEGWCSLTVDIRGMRRVNVSGLLPRIVPFLPLAGCNPPSIPQGTGFRRQARRLVPNPRDTPREPSHPAPPRGRDYSVHRDPTNRIEPGTAGKVPRCRLKETPVGSSCLPASEGMGIRPLQSRHEESAYHRGHPGLEPLRTPCLAPEHRSRNLLEPMPECSCNNPWPRNRESRR